VRRFVCGLALAALLAAPCTASADRAFSGRSSSNTHGDIAIAANSIEFCLDVLAVTRSRRPARNARICVRAPRREHREAGLGAAAPRTPLPAHRAARLGSAPRICLHAVAGRVTRARTAVVGITVQRVGVRTSLVLRIVPAPTRPPQLTG
jgi:hypothetical protein